MEHRSEDAGTAAAEPAKQMSAGVSAVVVLTSIESCINVGGDAGGRDVSWGSMCAIRQMPQAVDAV